MKALERWLDIRPEETRAVVLAALGAFLILGFMIVGRSLREAFYLTSFDVKTLPYITAAAAALSLAVVSGSSRFLASRPPLKVLQILLAVVFLGVAALWPLVNVSRVAIVVFYLWTSLGAMVLASGFWIVVADIFPLRSAKRLFGLISAGGTAGAMVIGTSLGKITRAVDVFWLVPSLLAFLGLLALVISLSPHGTSAKGEGETQGKERLFEGLKLLWADGHLRTLGLIVMTATVASTLLDYQFKEVVRSTYQSKQELTGFFGAFYGWTGAVSLALQIFLASRIVARWGVGWALAILPFCLFSGALGFFVWPGMLAATLVRGADNSLRKSIYRSGVEILYVPVSPEVRRKTKTLIDSTLDSAAEGLGAGLIFLWVSLGGFPSRTLSLGIAGFAVVFLLLSRRMHHRYFETLVDRLRERSEKPGDGDAAPGLFSSEDLLSVTMTRAEMPALLKALRKKAGASRPQESPPVTSPSLSNPSPSEDDLIRALARDALVPETVDRLAGLGDRVMPRLQKSLLDESEDFVIRRRIPRVLARMDIEAADRALLAGLTAGRFEVRYRCGLAIMRRKKAGMKETAVADRCDAIWKAVRFEVGHGKAVWEMQKVLDDLDPGDGDVFVEGRVNARGELSLEHTFRLLAVLLDPDIVEVAFRGILANDEKLKSYSLEYLEQVLPADVRDKLWPFIGDLSAAQKEKSARPLEAIVSDLVKTGATLFFKDDEKARLKKILGDS